MTAYQLEMLEVLRRIAQRGKRYAEDNTPPPEKFVDLFVHMLDEIDRLKRTSGDER